MKIILFALCLSTIGNVYAGAVGLLDESIDLSVNAESPASLVDVEKHIEVSADKPHPLGARPDCTEKEVSAQEIEKIAQNADSTIDFLKSLPQDSFQNFTFVTNSKSAQRCEGEGKVSPLWPRVLRSSVDGKVTFSYTCNPESCAYNQVEVIYFDDNGKQLKTMSLDFNQPERKVHHNDQSCINCHASNPDDPSTFKHIWPGYPIWGGCEGDDSINMYGSVDDAMTTDFYLEARSHEYKDCSTKDRKEAQAKEVENFQKFKAMHLGEGENYNPCYGLLPWAKPTGEAGSQYDPEKYENYPYFSKRTDHLPEGNSDNLENLFLVPNLRFTQAYAKINAQRIAGKVERSPDYEKIKFFLALEAAECLNNEDVKRINELLPNLKFNMEELAQSKDGARQDPRYANPLLYSYAKNIGISPSEWTLEYQSKDPDYNAVITRTSVRTKTNDAPEDAGVPEVVASELLKGLSSDYPQIASQSENSYEKGAENAFGKQWACLDKASPIKVGHRGEKRPLCLSIRAELEEYLKNLPALTVCYESPTRSKVVEMDDNAEEMVEVLDKASADRGEKIVNQRCMDCHSSNGAMNFYVPESFHFFSSSNESDAEKANAHEKMMKKLDNYEAALRSGRMPDDGGPRLSSDEIDDVLNYIKGLSQ